MTLFLNNLTVSKPNGEVLFEQFHAQIEPGQVLTVMGPSGCGKSTLLNLIAGHMSQDFRYTGEVLLNQKALDHVVPHARQIGILFQDDLLFPHWNVWQNLAFALPNEVKGIKRQQQAIACLEQVQLEALANAYPDQISGGQRARISLLRMLLAKPQAALLDEPFSKLDKELRSQFRDWVFEQLQRANVPTLLVTHDIDDAPNNAQVLHWPWQNHLEPQVVPDHA